MISYVIGFILGFIIGMTIVKYLLRDKTKDELRHDKTLQKKYGPLVWLCALLGLLGAIIFNSGFFI